MPCLITGLHMQIDEIICTKSIQSCLSLTFEIGVVESCSSFHFDELQACIMTYSTNQVHSRYHSPSSNLWIGNCQRRHFGAISPTPWPYTVGGILSFCSPLFVQRMVGKQRLALVYQVG